MLAASPASCCHAQTLNSFRFAQRARMVENQPKINVTKFGGRHKKSSSIFSGVSAFDLKNDIARLVSIIRSAQGVSQGFIFLFKAYRLAQITRNQIYMTNYYSSESDFVSFLVILNFVFYSRRFSLDFIVPLKSDYF